MRVYNEKPMRQSALSIDWSRLESAAKELERSVKGQRGVFSIDFNADHGQPKLIAIILNSVDLTEPNIPEYFRGYEVSRERPVIAFG